jgi:hypothetical protein
MVYLCPAFISLYRPMWRWAREVFSWVMEALDPVLIRVLESTMMMDDYIQSKFDDEYRRLTEITRSMKTKKLVWNNNGTLCPRWNRNMHNRLAWFIEFGRSYGDHELEFYCHMMRNLESLNAYECLVEKQTCRSLRPYLIGNQGRWVYCNNCVGEYSKSPIPNWRRRPRFLTIS